MALPSCNMLPNLSAIKNSASFKLFKAVAPFLTTNQPLLVASLTLSGSFSVIPLPINVIASALEL